MKQAKKLAAVLLSLVLVLALAVPASATGNYTITITDTKPTTPIPPIKSSTAIFPDQDTEQTPRPVQHPWGAVYNTR